MIEKALHKLQNKHLLVVGGTEKERKKIIDKIITETNFHYYRFPSNMVSMDEYVDFVRKEKLFTPWYSKKGKFNTNQLIDFHRDWILENSSLVLLEEFQEFDLRWKLDLLKSYLNQIQNRKKNEKAIKLIIPQENEDGLFEKFLEQTQMLESENRTALQILSGSLEIISLG